MYFAWGRYRMSSPKDPATHTAYVVSYFLIVSTQPCVGMSKLYMWSGRVNVPQELQGWNFVQWECQTLGTNLYIAVST